MRQRRPVPVRRLHGISVANRLEDDAFVDHLARARLVVSNNSGAGHIAARLGVPTIGIYTASHVPEIWGFRGPSVSILSARIACAGCGLDRLGHCPWGVRCKYAIEPEDVAAEAEALVAASGDQGPLRVTA